MSQLPFAEAVTRYLANEERVDDFVNTFGTYTTSNAIAIKTLPSLAAEFDTIAQAVGSGLLYATYSDANAAVGGMSDQTLVDVIADETHSGLHARYRVESGALVFKFTFDALRTDLAASTGLALIGSSSGNNAQVEMNLKPTVVASVAALNAATTASLPSGFIYLQSYNAGQNQGGGMLAKLTAPVTPDNVMTFNDASGASYRRLDAPVLEDVMGGVVGNAIADDTAAMQRVLDAVPSGGKITFNGTPKITSTLYCSAKNNVTLDFTNCEIQVAFSLGFSLMIHGGTLTRDSATYTQEIAEQAYADVTPSVGINILGYKATSALGGTAASQACAYFCNDLFIDAVIKLSNGSGLELRQCVRPRFGELRLEQINNYALFVYQCHGLRGGSLVTKECGRAYVIKQRHSFYETWDHSIDSVYSEDCHGVGSGVWATCGQGFNEQVRLGASALTIANRNFAGHEKGFNLRIGVQSFVVSNTADGTVSSPSIGIGCFADQVDFPLIYLDANGKDMTNSGLGIGNSGDIAEGQAGGATFGENHRIGKIIGKRFQSIIGNSNSFIQYGVTCVIDMLDLKSSTLARAIYQAPYSALPFYSVSSLTLRACDIVTNQYLGFYDQCGIGVLSNTRNFASGDLNITVTPVNSSSGSDVQCCPLYVASDSWICTGQSKPIVAANAAATNLTTVYGYVSTAAFGLVNVAPTISSPTHAYGALYSNPNTTTALTIAPATLTLVGTPAGVKTALTTFGRANLPGPMTYTGAWSTTLSDISGRNNEQNTKRRMWSAAQPTIGSWDYGDISTNSNPAIGVTQGWVTMTSGTLGTLNGGATTGAMTVGLPTLTVSSTFGISAGTYLSVAGAITFAKVLSVIGNTVTLSVNASATVSGAAVAYVAPTFRAMPVL